MFKPRLAEFAQSQLHSAHACDITDRINGEGLVLRGYRSALARARNSRIASAYPTPIINPRRACAAWVTIVVLCVCVSVCVSVCVCVCVSVSTYSRATGTKPVHER